MVLLDGCDIRREINSFFKNKCPGHRQFYGVRGKLERTKLQKLLGQLENCQHATLRNIRLESKQSIDGAFHTLRINSPAGLNSDVSP